MAALKIVDITGQTEMLSSMDKVVTFSDGKKYKARLVNSPDGWMIFLRTMSDRRVISAKRDIMIIDHLGLG